MAESLGKKLVAEVEEVGFDEVCRVKRFIFTTFCISTEHGRSYSNYG